jgi:uncharacterized protein involved in exopolysaccharide biosynthesis
MQSIESALAFLQALARAGLRHFVIVILSLVVCIAGAVFLVASRPPAYTASMTVKAVEDAGSGSPAANKGQAINALAGTLPTYFKLLESREVAQLLIDNEHFDRTLFWGAVDPATGEWRAQRPGLFRGMMDRLFGVTHSARPTAEDVQQRVAGLLVIDRDVMSDIATVSCTAPSPTLCAALLAAAHRQTENRLRQILREQARRSHDYVTAALPKTTDAGMRAALDAALETANAQFVAADLGQPLGATVIEPPSVPSEPIHPRPGLFLEAAAALGLALGLAIAWLLEARRGAKR